MKSKNQMNIVITIPAYNEEKTLPPVLKESKKVMKEHNLKYKLLVLNDGSKDKTAEVARAHGAKVVSNQTNQGLAVTFRREMEECLKLKADIIVHTDADGQYPSQYIPQLIKKIQEGNDLVLGSRFWHDNYSGSLAKKYGNMAFAKVFSSLLKAKLTDTTTGFRAFTKDVAKLPLINSFTYTQEQLIRAGKAGLKVAEIPITTRKTRKSRLFKNPFDYAWKAWINILRIYRDFAPLKFFGYTGGALLTLGAIMGFYIAGEIILTGKTSGIPRVILSALLILTGLQIIVFGFLADMVKK